MVMVENDYHNMIIAWSNYDYHGNDYGHSMSDHVRKIQKNLFEVPSTEKFEIEAHQRVTHWLVLWFWKI